MSTSKRSNQKQSRIPSRRDQEIFRRVVVRCELQFNVAKDLGLSPGRVSQILTRVRRWLACGATPLGPSPLGAGRPTPPNAASPTALDAAFSDLERQRLHRQLAQSRHEYLYEICIREID